MVDRHSISSIRTLYDDRFVAYHCQSPITTDVVNAYREDDVIDMGLIAHRCKGESETLLSGQTTVSLSASKRHEMYCGKTDPHSVSSYLFPFSLLP